MAKLDNHAELIKKLYSETGYAKATHQRLLQEGVDVCYETLRQWLHSHKDEVPALRSGAGKPKTKRPEQLFSLFDENPGWVPEKGIYPEFFMIFTDRGVDQFRDAVLVTKLTKLGIKGVSMETLEDCDLPLKRFRNLCDLEVYLLAYLLARQDPLVGVSDQDYDERIRVTMAMAYRLREVIMIQRSIRLGELRNVITKQVG